MASEEEDQFEHADADDSEQSEDDVPDTFKSLFDTLETPVATADGETAVQPDAHSEEPNPAPQAVPSTHIEEPFVPRVPTIADLRYRGAEVSPETRATVLAMLKSWQVHVPPAATMHVNEPIRTPVTVPDEWTRVVQSEDTRRLYTYSGPPANAVGLRNRCKDMQADPACLYTFSDRDRRQDQHIIAGPPSENCHLSALVGCVNAKPVTHGKTAPIDSEVESILCSIADTPEMLTPMSLLADNDSFFAGKIKLPDTPEFEAVRTKFKIIPEDIYMLPRLRAHKSQVKARKATQATEREKGMDVSGWRLWLSRYFMLPYIVRPRCLRSHPLDSAKRSSMLPWCSLNPYRYCEYNNEWYQPLTLAEAEQQGARYQAEIFLFVAFDILVQCPDGLKVRVNMHCPTRPARAGTLPATSLTAMCHTTYDRFDVAAAPPDTIRVGQKRSADELALQNLDPHITGGNMVPNGNRQLIMSQQTKAQGKRNLRYNKDNREIYQSIHRDGKTSRYQMTRFLNTDRASTEEDRRRQPFHKVQHMKQYTKTKRAQHTFATVQRSRQAIPTELLTPETKKPDKRKRPKKDEGPDKRKRAKKDEGPDKRKDERKAVKRKRPNDEEEEVDDAEEKKKEQEEDKKELEQNELEIFPQREEEKFEEIADASTRPVDGEKADEEDDPDMIRSNPAGSMHYEPSVDETVASSTSAVETKDTAIITKSNIAAANAAADAKAAKARDDEEAIATSFNIPHQHNHYLPLVPKTQSEKVSKRVAFSLSGTVGAEALRMRSENRDVYACNSPHITNAQPHLRDKSRSDRVKWVATYLDRTDKQINQSIAKAPVIKQFHYISEYIRWCIPMLLRTFGIERKEDMKTWLLRDIDPSPHVAMLCRKIVDDIVDHDEGVTTRKQALIQIGGVWLSEQKDKVQDENELAKQGLFYMQKKYFEGLTTDTTRTGMEAKLVKLVFELQHMILFVARMLDESDPHSFVYRCVLTPAAILRFNFSQAWIQGIAMLQKRVLKTNSLIFCPKVDGNHWVRGLDTIVSSQVFGFRSSRSKVKMAEMKTEARQTSINVNKLAEMSQMCRDADRVNRHTQGRARLPDKSRAQGFSSPTDKPTGKSGGLVHHSPIVSFPSIDLPWTAVQQLHQFVKNHAASEPMIHRWCHPMRVEPRGAKTTCTPSMSVGTKHADPGSAETKRAEPRGAEIKRAETKRAEPRGAERPKSEPMDDHGPEPDLMVRQIADTSDSRAAWIIMIDENPVCCTFAPELIWRDLWRIKTLPELQQIGLISSPVRRTINVATRSGRPLRPMLVAGTHPPLAPFGDRRGVHVPEEVARFWDTIQTMEYACDPALSMLFQSEHGRQMCVRVYQLLLESGTIVLVDPEFTDGSCIAETSRDLYMEPLMDPTCFSTGRGSGRDLSGGLDKFAASFVSSCTSVRARDCSGGRAYDMVELHSGHNESWPDMCTMIPHTPVARATAAASLMKQAVSGASPDYMVAHAKHIEYLYLPMRQLEFNVLGLSVGWHTRPNSQNVYTCLETSATTIEDAGRVLVTSMDSGLYQGTCSRRHQRTTYSTHRALKHRQMTTFRSGRVEIHRDSQWARSMSNTSFQFPVSPVDRLPELTASLLRRAVGPLKQSVDRMMTLDTRDNLPHVHETIVTRDSFWSAVPGRVATDSRRRRRLVNMSRRVDESIIAVRMAYADRCKLVERELPPDLRQQLARALRADEKRMTELMEKKSVIELARKQEGESYDDGLSHDELLLKQRVDEQLSRAYDPNETSSSDEEETPRRRVRSTYDYVPVQEQDEEREQTRSMIRIAEHQYGSLVKSTPGLVSNVLISAASDSGLTHANVRVGSRREVVQNGNKTSTDGGQKVTLTDPADAAYISTDVNGTPIVASLNPHGETARKSCGRQIILNHSVVSATAPDLILTQTGRSVRQTSTGQVLYTDPKTPGLGKEGYTAEQELPQTWAQIELLGHMNSADHLWKSTMAARTVARAIQRADADSQEDLHQEELLNIWTAIVSRCVRVAFEADVGQYWSYLLATWADRDAEKATECIRFVANACAHLIRAELCFWATCHSEPCVVDTFTVFADQHMNHVQAVLEDQIHAELDLFHHLPADAAQVKELCWYLLFLRHHLRIHDGMLHRHSPLLTAEMLTMTADEIEVEKRRLLDNAKVYAWSNQKAGWLSGKRQVGFTASFCIGKYVEGYSGQLKMCQDTARDQNTLQPTKSREKDGASQMNYMETFCLLQNNGNELYNERVNHSDVLVVRICTRCKNTAYERPDGTRWCDSCDDGSDVVDVKTTKWIQNQQTFFRLAGARHGLDPDVNTLVDVPVYMTTRPKVTGTRVQRAD